MDDRQLRRAGLDYHELATVRTHRDWPACRQFFGARRMFAFTTRATRLYTEPAYARGDVLVFGAETRGLRESLLAEFSVQHRLRLPMRAGNRSINLSNAVAIAVFEAWRQLGFEP
jgi:tRNA (cytidine/uridine-2'-O-)-methyltransferase